MNNHQLRSALLKNYVTRRYFRGVYPSDRLPYKLSQHPSLLIVNTDPHYKPGKHWIVIYVPRYGPVEFFDSFGHAPAYYNRNFTDFLRRMERGVKYNKKILQAQNSLMCGPYCLYYAIHRCKGIAMDKITSYFGRNGRRNDETVFHFIKKYFRL